MNKNEHHADDMKIWTQLSHPEDALQLQMDLDKLNEWSARWILKFNSQKRKVMHLWQDMDTKYYITQYNQQWDISSVQQEKDLGVLTCSDLMGMALEMGITP